MKNIILIFLSALALYTHAEDIGLPWLIECENNHCLLQVESPYQKAGKDEYVALMVSYNKLTQSVNKVGIVIPSGDDVAPHIFVKFLDTLPSGNSYKLEEAKGKTLKIKIDNCDEHECVAVSEASALSTTNQAVDWDALLKNKEHIWIAFARSKQHESAMLPTYKFRHEIKNIHGTALSESKSH